VKNKIAFEFFGQLRMWDIQDGLENLKNFFNEEGFSVDFFGTFWDDDYTNSLVDKGEFENFKSLQLIEEPDIDDVGLQKYFHSLKKSVEQRKQTNTEYKLIIQARPDLKFKLDGDSSSKFKNILKLLEENDDVPMVFLDRQLSHPSRTEKIEDKFIVSNELGANALSHAIDECDDFTYHIGLHYAIEKLVVNVVDIEIFFRVKLFRHALLNESNFDDDFNHDSLVDDKNLDGYVREYLKTIQDTSILKKEIERLR
tara:strand:- start:461 stop:1225 length:765 start_codon:yes stop_codon:yes gene_type:complete